MTKSQEQLNSEQTAAVSVGPGVFTLDGVPGSGKTRTIVERISRLVQDGLDPMFILAMTFTRAAAQEMTERLQAMGITGGRVGTIHSVALQIASAETRLPQGAKVDDKGALEIELRKLLTDLRRTNTIPEYGVDREGVRRYIGDCKASGPSYVFGDPLGMNGHADAFLAQMSRKWAVHAGLPPSKLMNIFIELERRRAVRGLYDFDDMLQWAWLALTASWESRRRWRNRWSVVIVDEAQDSSPVQWDLARYLVGLGSCIAEREGGAPWDPGTDDGPHNLMIGGQCAQAIYSWRSGDVETYQSMAKQFGLMPLAKNYRSRPAICQVTQALGAGKAWSLKAVIEPVREADPGVPHPVRIVRYDKPMDEAMGVVDACQARGALGGSVVLARLGASLDLIEIVCIRRRLRYYKMASGSFFDSKECMDLLGYLRVASECDPEDAWFARIINRPFRFIGSQFIAEVQGYAQTKGVDILSALELHMSRLTGRQRTSLRKFVALIKELREVAQESAWATQADMVITEGCVLDDALGAALGRATARRVRRGPVDMLRMILEQTHYLDELKREEGLLGLDESKVAAIGELGRMASQFAAVPEFLTYTDDLAAAVRGAERSGLRAKRAGDPDVLTLSTVHRFKGLERPHVHVVDMVQGHFPCARALDPEEERRLMYVAVSRAQETCTLSYAGEPMVRGRRHVSDDSEEGDNIPSPYLYVCRAAGAHVVG